MIDNYIQESSPPTKWRQRVEVYIIKNEKLLVGFQKYNKRYAPVGGGIEKGQTLKTAAETEALEELGVKIKNISSITKKTFKVDWYDLRDKGVWLSDKILKRMQKYRGQEIYFVKAEFDGIDKKIYGRDGDSMIPVEITKQKLIQEFNKGVKWDVNKFRIKIVRML